MLFILSAVGWPPTRCFVVIIHAVGGVEVRRRGVVLLLFMLSAVGWAADETSGYSYSFCRRRGGTPPGRFVIMLFILSAVGWAADEASCHCIIYVVGGGLGRR